MKNEKRITLLQLSAISSINASIRFHSIVAHNAVVPVVGSDPNRRIPFIGITPESINQITTLII
jgi:hypothetical protein